MIAASQQPGIVWLIGMMGAGKSTVGRLLAGLLGRPFVDLDKRIEAQAGRTILQIFETDGEPAFRVLEARTAAEVAAEARDAVVATGGGAPCYGDTMRMMKSTGLVLWLRADVDEIFTRIDVSRRPLLAGANDPRSKLLELEVLRRDSYLRADLVVERGARDSATVAADIAAWLEQYGPAPLAYPPGEELAVTLAHTSYPILIDYGAGGAGDAPGGAAARFAAHLARRAPPARAEIGLVTDEHVRRLHGDRYLAALHQRGFRVVAVTVPTGEGSKSLARAEAVADALAQGGLDRRSTLIALGGGVVGDLAGFVASVLFRGIALAQVPTTLLAQVDASVGGKTGVNLPSGKNLVGSFHQPLLVFIDVGALATLDPRDLSSGLAEVVKHAFLEGGPLLERLEARAEEARAGDPRLLGELIAASCAIKARVVAADEREIAPTGGRALLNLGHTLGHALETASLSDPGGPLRHGEAVSLGLIGAARVSRALGGDPGLEARAAALLGRLGLPVDLDARLTREALERLRVDKKRAGGAIQFVVIDRPGTARLVPLSPERLAEMCAPAI